MPLIKTSVINHNYSRRYPLHESLTEVFRLVRECRVWLDFCSKRESAIDYLFLEILKVA